MPAAPFSPTGYGRARHQAVFCPQGPMASPLQTTPIWGLSPRTGVVWPCQTRRGPILAGQSGKQLKKQAGRPWLAPFCPPKLPRAFALTGMGILPGQPNGAAVALPKIRNRFLFIFHKPGPWFGPTQNLRLKKPQDPAILKCKSFFLDKIL